MADNCSSIFSYAPKSSYVCELARCYIMLLAYLARSKKSIPSWLLDDFKEQHLCSLSHYFKSNGVFWIAYKYFSYFNPFPICEILVYILRFFRYSSVYSSIN